MRFHLNFVVWKERFAEKIDQKHYVSIDEVEDVLFSSPHVRMVERGRVKGENVFAAYGRTKEGRYLIVFFIRKPHDAALPISARDMTPAERRYYRAQKESD